MNPPLPGFTPWPAEVAAYYRSAGIWHGETFGQMLRARARKFAKRLAIVCGERRWSYAELDQKADQLAGGLSKLGIRKHDRVVVQLPNRAEFYALIFALFRIGAIPVFALPAHRRSEIVHFCQHAQAVAYIVADQAGGFDYRVLAREVSSELGRPLHTVVLGEAAEFTPFASLYQAYPALPEPTAGEVAFLQLSGGSTGLPKLIPRTHDDYLYSVRESAHICGLGVDSVYLCALPQAHNFPLSSPGALGVLYAGGCVVMAPDPSSATCFKLIEQEGVSITAIVPPLAALWLDEASRQPKLAGKPQALASLQVLQVGGAKLAASVAARLQDELGCRLQQVFGMAEGLVCYTRLDDPLELILHSQGLPISSLDEVRVVDEDDHDLPDGEVGHLLTRGPYTLRGYYLAQAHNAQAFTADGFYRSGDLVRRLPSGHLVVEGRAKDQINRGGEKIACEEVENHLLAHPDVAQAAIVAMPDAYLGEKSCAYLVLHRSVRGMALNRFLQERGLAIYKIPDRYEFTDALPKTAVGKVDKRALRARLTVESA